MKVISRSNGRSSIAAAAYRSAEKIADIRTGLVHDYSRKSGVDESMILAPSKAPDWVYHRDELWNTVESIEKRKDAQLCREVEVAFPIELNRHQMVSLVKSFVSSEFVSKGMIADVNIHHANGENPHAHILLTTREVSPDGFGKKNRSWNKKELLQGWRKSWEAHTNKALEQAGCSQRIDHRSLTDQGIDRVPQIHLGPNVIQMEKRGIRTERAETSKRIEQDNQEITRLYSLRQSLDEHFGPETLLEEIQRKFGSEKDSERNSDSSSLSVAELYRQERAKRLSLDVDAISVSETPLKSEDNLSTPSFEESKALSDADVLSEWERLLSAQIERLAQYRRLELKNIQDQRHRMKDQLERHISKKPVAPEKPAGLGGLFKRKEYEAAYRQYEGDFKDWYGKKYDLERKKSSLNTMEIDAKDKVNTIYNDAFIYTKNKNTEIYDALSHIRSQNESSNTYHRVSYRWNDERNGYTVKIEGNRPCYQVTEELIRGLRRNDNYLGNFSVEEISGGFLPARATHGDTPDPKFFDKRGKKVTDFKKIANTQDRKSYEVTYKWEKRSQSYTMKIDGRTPSESVNRSALATLKAQDKCLQHYTVEQIASGRLPGDQIQNGHTPQFITIDECGKAYEKTRQEELMDIMLNKRVNSQSLGMSR